MLHLRLRTTLLLFIIAITAACSVPAQDEHQAPRAVKGVLDLRGYDFAADGTLVLAGEWGFYWDTVITSDTFQDVIDRSPDHYVEVPSYWDKLIKTDSNIKAQGVATYSLKVLMNPTDDSAAMALKFLSITPNAKIFVDGQLIAEIGHVDMNREYSESGNRILLTPLTGGRDSFILSVSISNFHNVNGGLNRPIQFGLYDNLLKKRELNLSLDALFMGGLMLMGLYQLSLFMLSTRRKAPLFMAMLCFLAFIFSGFKNEMVILSVFPGWDGEIRTKFIYLVLTLSGPILMLYAYTLYPRHFKKMVNRILLSIALVFSIIIITTPKAFFTRFILPLEILVLFSSLYTILMLVSGYFKTKDRGILYYLSGLGFLVICIIFGILDNAFSIVFQSVAGIFMVFILYQAFLQAYIFSSAFTEIETLSTQKKKLEKRNVELFSLSYIDSLTETCNRRLMDDFLSSNWRVNTINDRSVGMILIDIDDFRSYNDHFGHKQGDACLIKVCNLLRDELNTLGQDTLARYGGEEFAVILSDMEELTIFQTAEKLRKAVENGNILHPASQTSEILTISIGCAYLIPARDEAPESLIDAAAKALHRAKNNGKNRTEIYGDESTDRTWGPKLVSDY